MDDPGANYRWALARTVDGRFWNDTTLTWDVGSVYNSFTASTVLKRDRSKAIPIGAAATTVTFYVIQVAGGTVLRVNRTYHVQLEPGTHPTSRIVTDAVMVTRAAQTYTIPNLPGARVFNNTSGSGMCRVRTSWNGADAPDFPVLWETKFGAGNYWTVWWYGATKLLYFTMAVGGVEYNATIPWLPIADTDYLLGWRWTSAAGELGLAARTISIFVDGVKGIDSVRSGDPIEASTLTLGAGWNGTIRRFLLTQEVYTDRQMASGVA
jgi:hypothetical protein